MSNAYLINQKLSSPSNKKEVGNKQLCTEATTELLKQNLN